MNRTFISRLWGSLKLLGLILLVLATFVLGYSLRNGSSPSAPSDSSPEHVHAMDSMSSDKKPTLWTCAMHPQIQQPRPGKCPLCGMALVPVKSQGGGLRQITISPETRKLMALETTPVQRKGVTAPVRMVGKIAYDERRMSYITAWVAGRLDRLYADYTGVSVKKGDHMVYMYSPDLYGTQNELILALEFSGLKTGGIDTVQAAREKLRLLGLTPEQIQQIEKTRQATYNTTIYAPTGGIVVDKRFNQGDYVKVGDRIYAIADLTQLWVLLDAYESDLPWVRYGQEVTFTTEAHPGVKFVGKIAFIDPVLNDRTRTVKVRVNVPNPSGLLKPDMFVSGVVSSQIAADGRVIDESLAGKWISPMHPEVVKDGPGKCDICGMPLVRTEELGYAPADKSMAVQPLVIPRSAAMVTGTRAIVYVELLGKGQPTYVGREIVLGPRAGDYYLVKGGLKEGELVVTQGNFKLDSALQIQAKPSMMTPEGGGGGGHHHGGPSETKGGPSQGPMAMEIPAEFHQQLAKLEQAAKGVAEAVEADDVAKVRTAFTALGKALEAVEAKRLKDHPRILWDEFAMLLGNDVTEGREVKQLSEARRVAGLLKDHLRRVQEQLGMSHGEHGGHGIASFEVPPAFQKQLAGLWPPYQALQKELAQDRTEQAQPAVVQLGKALAAVDAGPLAAPARAAWEKERAQLTAILGSLEKASDLKTLREAFATLSGELAAVVRTFGLGDAGPVYQLRCSMAFGGRGAGWLQMDDQPRNPYFGAAMPACADDIRQIAGKEELPTPGGEHRHD